MKNCRLGVILTFLGWFGSLQNGSAADVRLYGILKGESFVQGSAAAPQPSGATPFLFLAFVDGTAPNSVNSAFLSLPSGDFKMLAPDAGGESYVSREAFGTQAALDAGYPEGEYNLTILPKNDQFANATLDLGPTVFPPTPQISNYTAAQSVDPAQSFSLSWNPFAGATAADFVQVALEDSNGTTVFATPDYGAVGALDGTQNSVAIPAGRLQSGSEYTVRLLFTKVDAVDTTSYPGARGVVGFFKETTTTVRTSGSNVDTTPPVLSSSSPPNNASSVSANTPVTFTFSERMAPVQSISWSGNVSANKFSYAWSADNRTLTATYSENLPATGPITWTLNPAGQTGGFTDLAGNRLATTSGQFTVSCSGTNAPSTTGSFSVFKSVNYVQTSASGPVLDPDSPPSFSAFVSAPNNYPLSSVVLTLPNGSTKNLENLFGSSFFLHDTFESQAALDAAYPNGTYRLRMNGTDGTSRTATLDLSSGFPAVPHVTNFDATQTLNPNADFTLNWMPPNAQSISLTISDSNAVVFAAPDHCVPRELAPTATSVVIPRGTFSSGKIYDGSLHFSRGIQQDTTTFPGGFGTAGFIRLTSFRLRSTGGTGGSAPRFAAILREAARSIRLRLTGQPNVNYTIEGSADLRVWTFLTRTSSPSGTIEYVDPQAPGLTHRFYRARTD